MAVPKAAPHPYRPSSVVLGGRRGIPATVTVRATAIADLMDELTAAGTEMRSAGMTLQYADRAGRRDLALQTAARLVVRGEGYIARGTR
jgi:hypothetical protein